MLGAVTTVADVCFFQSMLIVQLMLGLLHPGAVAVSVGPNVVKNISFVSSPVIEPDGQEAETSTGGNRMPPEQ